MTICRKLATWLQRHNVKDYMKEGVIAALGTSILGYNVTISIPYSLNVQMQFIIYNPPNKYKKKKAKNFC